MDGQNRYFDEFDLEVRVDNSDIEIMPGRQDVLRDILVDRFVEYLKSERNYSPNTVSSYVQDLSQFAAFLWHESKVQPPFSWEKVSHAGARGFLVKFHRNGNAPATTRRKLASLRAPVGPRRTRESRLIRSRMTPRLPQSARARASENSNSRCQVLRVSRFRWPIPSSDRAERRSESSASRYRPIVRGPSK